MRPYRLLALMAVACLLAGCQSSRKAASVAPLPAPKKAPAAPLQDAPVVHDSGYIKALIHKAGGWHITIAYADLMRGEKARKAAIEDKTIGPDDDLEDDYYIRETDQTGTFGLAENVPILLTGDTQNAGKPVTLAEFARGFNSRHAQTEDATDAFFKFTLSGDRVIKIEQQYVP